MPTFEFDRYSKGELKADGIRITRGVRPFVGQWDADLASASLAAIRLADPGDVLVLRTEAADLLRQRDDEIHDAAGELLLMSQKQERWEEMLRQWEVMRTDPLAVRVNLLNGTLARPDNLLFKHDTNGPYAALMVENEKLRELLRQARAVQKPPVIMDEDCAWDIHRAERDGLAD